MVLKRFGIRRPCHSSLNGRNVPHAMHLLTCARSTRPSAERIGAGIRSRWPSASERTFFGSEVPSCYLGGDGTIEGSGIDFILPTGWHGTIACKPCRFCSPCIIRRAAVFSHLV